MNQILSDLHPENKTPYIVCVNDEVISKGDNPVVVYADAESKIIQGGNFIIYEGAFIHKKQNATPIEMKIALRGLSKGVTLWAIDIAYREVKEKLSDMMVMGLTEAEAVIFIIREYAEILPNDFQRCSEAILNTEFSPQYFSKTYTRAKAKMSNHSKDDNKVLSQTPEQQTHESDDEAESIDERIETRDKI